MSIIRGVRSELLKLCHTAVLWLHVMIPVIGAAVFLLYFALYQNTENIKKAALVLELTAVVFPIIVGMVCGMMSSLEERAGHFQTMMMSPAGRVIPYLNKLFAAISLGGTSTLLLVGLIAAGSNAFSLEHISWEVLFLSAFGMFLGTIPLYVIHMFLSIGWGLGISVFVGVAESMLAVMFSNVDIVTWPFIPCAWGVMFLRNTLFSVTMTMSEIIPIIVLSLVFLLLSFAWFGRWDGRKSAE